MTEPFLISTEYTLVIDTDSISFSFFKKLCAYCTGMTDEEENEEEIAMSNLFYLEEGIEDDESSKGKTAEEKNYFYGYVSQRLNEDQVYSPCCVWLNKNYGYNSEGSYALLTDDNYEDFNCPAPMSVGIFFDEHPEEQQIENIKKRAYKFFELNQKIDSSNNIAVKIEGFRLVTHTKYGVEKAL